MVENRVFLREDIFSHTLLGAEWINFEWLSQIMMYLIYKGDGLRGLFLSHIFFGFTAIGFLALALWKAGAKGLWFYLLTWVGFMLLAPRLSERPELATMNLMGFLVLVLLEGRTSNVLKRKAIPWLFGVMMILWCNLHAGFIYGFGLVVLLDMGARLAHEDKEYVAMLDQTVVLTLVAVLINPSGPKVGWIFIEHLFQLKEAPPLIAEWKPLEVQEHPLFWTAFVVSGGLVVWGLAKRWRHAQFWSFSIIAFSVWGAMHNRNAALLAFVMLPFLAGLSARSVWRPGSFNNTAVLSAVVGLCYMAPLAATGKYLKNPFPQGFVAWHVYPVKACEFVKKNNLQGHMHNWYELGGYIEWALGPDRKIFMDGRYIFHPLLLQEYNLGQAHSGEFMMAEWDRYFKKHGVSYAIVKYPDNASGVKFQPQNVEVSLLNVMFPRSQWALVFWDDAALVFLKRVSKNDELIRRFEYNLLWPYNLEQMKYSLEQGFISADQARLEVERHKRDVGFTVRGQEIEKLIQTKEFK